MPPLSAKELVGLHRTFPPYVKFPEAEWPQLRLAETAPRLEASRRSSRRVAHCYRCPF